MLAAIRESSMDRKGNLVEALNGFNFSNAFMWFSRISR
jgi:hypothetical protein